MDGVAFPDIPIYRGWGAPLRIESDIRDLECVQGSVPRDLNGTLYRCGPDRQYPPMTADDIFIDGEGMAHMFRFEDGHVDYRSRWVRNERFLLQEQARPLAVRPLSQSLHERSERRRQEPGHCPTPTWCGTAASCSS